MQNIEEVRKRYPKFADRVRYGVEHVDMIDDYIDEWHEGDGSEPLQVFLGLTWEQMAEWTESGNEALDKMIGRSLTPEEESEVERLYDELQDELKSGDPWDEKQGDGK